MFMNDQDQFDQELFLDHINLLLKSGWCGNALEVLHGLHRDHHISPQLHDDISTTVRDFMRRNPDTQNVGQQVYGLIEESLISSLQFCKLETEEEMRRSFKQAVRWIEIETSSQCNRKCHYCPNSTIDRRSNNAFMDQEVFTSMIADLMSIDYDGKLVLVGLNEILMHEENFAYIEVIKHCLPQCSLTIFSNGDYIDDLNIRRLASLGVDDLIITFHNGPNKPFSPENALTRAHKFIQKTKVPLLLELYDPGIRLQFESQVDQMKVVACATNFDKVGHDWGGNLDMGHTEKRNAPCSYPIRQFVVNHEGDIFMCCVVPRAKTEKNLKDGALVGNLRDHATIFHAYASEPMRQWRDAAFRNGDLPSPCDTCTGHDGIDESRIADLVEQVAIARELNA